MSSSVLTRPAVPATRQNDNPAAQAASAPSACAPNRALLRRKTIDSLAAAQRLLVVGETGEAFANAYREAHPTALILRPGQEPAALAAAAASCDKVVLPDGLGAVPETLAVLKLLAAHCPAEVELVIEFAISDEAEANFEAVSPPDNAAQARDGCRAGLVKLLMDAGWMPHVGDYVFREGSNQWIEGVIVESKRSFAPAGRPPLDTGETARFAVVVPTNRSAEFEANVKCSPGLGEVQAPIYAVRNAKSPADALDTALPHVAQDWVLICHQDVYFPEGFGRGLNALLAEIAPQDHERTLLGFIGKSVDAAKQGYRTAGFVVDRLLRVEADASNAAVSIDELALVISRKSLHRIDPSMGWHLWGTDLCLASICKLEVMPRIVRLPICHNSRNDSSLDESFHSACVRLLNKYPDFGPIPTMCGVIQPAEAPVARVVPASVPAEPTRNGCCICDHPVREWLPHPHASARSEFSRLLGAVGSDLSVYQCPACFSTDRDRHLWHYMNAVGLVDRIASMRVLHIAPERHIEALLLQVPPLEYVRGDLHPWQAEHRRLDVEALPFDDASFDLIICNHVLEHVASPSKALAQFNRCLATGGVLIAQTPYAPGLRNTFEMNGPVSPAFARLFYGQDDHARLFGADIVQAFHDAGFVGELLPHQVVLPGIDAKANGCNAQEPFFCFSK